MQAFDEKSFKKIHYSQIQVSALAHHKSTTKNPIYQTKWQLFFQKK